MPRPVRGRVDRHGRRFRVTWWVNGVRLRRTFVTEREADSFLLTLRRQQEADASPESQRIKGGLTVWEVVDNWYRDHKRNLSSGTQRDYECRIKREVSRIGSLDASELARNPRDLRAFYATLTPTNARRLHAILRQAFEDAVRHGELDRNPSDAARPRKPRPAERLIPSPTEVEKMVVAAEEEEPVWGLFLNLTATLGTRRAETCALRWDDIDFTGFRVHIRRALCKGVAGPKEIKLPKTGVERTLLVGPEFFDEIRPVRGTGWIFSGGRRGIPDQPWHPDWPGHRFQGLMKRLELPYTLHSLRHFVATQLLARGLPVTQVAQFMGHKDPSVTMNLYANHVVDDVQRAMGAAAASLFRRT
jgi:integrase